MEGLSGIKFGGLLTSYTDIRGLVSKEVLIDFKYNLAQMWKNKIERYRKNKGEHSDRLILLAKKALEEFDNVENKTFTIDKKLEELKDTIENIKSDIDWVKVSEIKSLSSEGSFKYKLFKQLVDKIDAHSILSYSITEIMPTKDENAYVGVMVYDFLSKNAGLNFIDYIPALGDDLVSIGSFQFTDPAVASCREMQSKYFKKGGHIPRAVENLQREYSDKAAFIFAFYNLLGAVSKMTENKQAEIIFTKNYFTKKDVKCFMSAAHNLPSAAYLALRDYMKYLVEWNKKNNLSIRNNAKNKITRKVVNTKVGPRKDYLYFIKNRSKVAGDYAQKTVDNAKAFS